MAQYGLVTTTESMKRQLLEMNKDYEGKNTWAELYGAVDFQKQQELSSLKSSYAGAELEDYVNIKREQAAIKGSNLGSGLKDYYLDETELELQSAYDKYRLNYQSQAADIEAEVASKTAAIDEALTLQAESMSKYEQAHLGYLQSLYEREGEKGEESMFLTNKNWQKYLNETVDEETGEIDYNLRTSQDLMSTFYDYNAETGAYTLNLKGMDFYDQMENELAQSGEYSWQQYLSESDPELLDWAMSSDPYNYTIKNTNAATFAAMIGNATADDSYTFLERAGGFTSEEIDTMFKDVKGDIDAIQELYNIADLTASKKAGLEKMYGEDALKLTLDEYKTELENKYGKDSSQYLNAEETYNTYYGKDKNVTEYVTNLTSNFIDVAKGLGIEQEFTNDLGLDSIRDLENIFNSYDAETKTFKDMNADYFSTVAASAIATGIGAGAAGMGGAAIGTAIAGAGAIGTTLAGAAAGATFGGVGAIPGAVVGLIVGLVGAAAGGGIAAAGAEKSKKEQNELNKQAAKQAIDQYARAVDLLVYYTKQKQMQVQDKFNYTYG